MSRDDTGEKGTDKQTSGTKQDGTELDDASKPAPTDGKLSYILFFAYLQLCNLRGERDKFLFALLFNSIENPYMLSTFDLKMISFVSLQNQMQPY